MSEFVVVDVGGTTLAAAVVVGDAIVGEAVRSSSHQGDDADTILGHFAAAIDRAGVGRQIALAVVAMPAPFDYARGVSHLDHKFAALRGLDVGAALRERVGIEVLFVNDAEAAAIGTWIELERPTDAVATITLGTGVGSGLVVDGEFAGHNEIWRWPYLDGIVENRVSSHAISESHARRTERDVAVAVIAETADQGDPEAVAALAEYGAHLGAAVAAYFAEARPTTISCTGGVTGAWHHIEPTASAAYRAAGGAGRLVRSALTDPALVGGAEIGRRRLHGAPSA